MHRPLALLLALSAATALAQAPQPKLEPIAEPPQPLDAVSEPNVRIPVQEGDKVEVVRRDGASLTLKVTPRDGAPYYLIDTTGSGNWMRRDALDDGVRVPMWTIQTFD